MASVVPGDAQRQTTAGVLCCVEVVRRGVVGITGAEGEHGDAQPLGMVSEIVQPSPSIRTQSLSADEVDHLLFMCCVDRRGNTSDGVG